MTETYAVELEPFGIRVLLVAPGAFKTENIYSQEFFRDNEIADYHSMRISAEKRFGAVAGTQAGDPDKAMEAVVDVVRGEGVTKGRPWPRYLVLGEDAGRDVRMKSERILGVLDEWNDVTSGVGFD